MTEVRDRMTNPSINFPESQEEAFQALVHQVRRLVFEDFRMKREFTTDAGLGYTRTQLQADWLNNARSILTARLEDLLDAIDASAKDDS